MVKCFHITTQMILDSINRSSSKTSAHSTIDTDQRVRRTVRTLYVGDSIALNDQQSKRVMAFYDNGAVLPHQTAMRFALSRFFAQLSKALWEFMRGIRCFGKIRWA
jgi:hypothetical protein